MGLALTLAVCGSVHVLPGYSCGCDTCSDPCRISNCLFFFSVEEEAYAQVGVLFYVASATDLDFLYLLSYAFAVLPLAMFVWTCCLFPGPHGSVIPKVI